MLSSRLPVLWRVCKLAYNETYNVPFTSGNIFDFCEWTVVVLLQKYDPSLIRRIKSLALPKSHEMNLSSLVRPQSASSSDLVSIDGIIRHRKRNLRRLLPALTDIWLESHVESLIRFALGHPQMRAYFEEMARVEKDRVSRVVSFWRPLVSRVHVVEVQDE